MPRTVKQEELAYSTKDKKLFWVAGYIDGNTNSVDAFVRGLHEARDAFVQATRVPAADVCSYEILSSRRYKNMRVFFAETEACPPGVQALTNHSSMHAYLSD